jgi:DNA polymerase-3 subunit epsilon
MTRGQDALLMDLGPGDGVGAVIAPVDLRGLELPVLRASEQEMAAHEEVLGQLDKSSGGKTVWRGLAPGPMA